MEQEKSSQEQERRAYQTLKEAIVKGLFPPGYRLVERNLAQQLLMSRTPVRWAIKRLEAEGYLERTPNRGVALKLLSPEQVIELLYIREALEGMAGRLAARNRTEEQRRRLMEIVGDMAALTESTGMLGYYKLCGDLHHLILEASHNEYLINLATQVNSQVARFQYKNLLLVGRVHQSIAEHRQIAEAICVSDEARAEDAIRSHIKVVRELITEEVKKSGFLAY